jgi:hypothetical protein
LWDITAVDTLIVSRDSTLSITCSRSRRITGCAFWRGSGGDPHLVTDITVGFKRTGWNAGMEAFDPLPAPTSRILLYEEFEGHPLRKDYPMQAPAARRGEN